jgi:uncharacterized protein (DUF2384 family)
MEHRIKLSVLAAEALGAKAALKWLESPQEVLDGKRPVDVWDDPESIVIIERTLLRMQGLPKIKL